MENRTTSFPKAKLATSGVSLGRPTAMGLDRSLRQRLGLNLRHLTHIAFALFIGLALATPAWRVGPFTWWPLWRAPMLAGRAATVGVLALLPIGIGLAWLARQGLQSNRSSVAGEQRPWWGSLRITGPLMLVSLVVLFNLEMAFTWRTVGQATGLILLWFVYLFVLTERPDLTLVLAGVLLIQSVVGLGQFFMQQDLNLAFLGELDLDASVAGISIIWDRAQWPWLRAYGLTAHPNVLGTMTALLLLWLLPAWHRARPGRRLGLTLVLMLGLLLLLATFSRSAWLGLGLGLLVWLWRERPRIRLDGSLLLILLPAFFFLLAQRELVAGRFLALETAIEARSISQRALDWQVAPALLAQRPLQGVGAGNYSAAAEPVDPLAVVAHNVTLLVMAELGLVGLLAWLLLALGGLRARYPAPWLAMLTISLFDNALWVTTSWRAAILFALLAASLTHRLTERGEGDRA